MSDIWLGCEPTPESPYYPYRKVTDDETLAGAEKLPYVLTKYLMDLSLPGYTPPSDNRYPRARLKKLLYWDTPDALERPLPTDKQMLSVFFDSKDPGTPPDPARGYRIYPQELTYQAQTDSQSILRVYMGENMKLPSKGGFVLRQTVIYTVICGYAIESNLYGPVKSRGYALAQAIIEATAGINFGGVGGMEMKRLTKFDDERSNTGYKIYQQIDWAGGAPNPLYMTKGE